MLQFCLILIILPYFSLAQGIKTKGKLIIKGSGCIKIRVKGGAVFSDSTQLKGSADFQADQRKKDFEKPCKDSIFKKGCTIEYKSESLTISMNNLQTGTIKVSFFNLLGQEICTFTDEKAKTLRFWYYRQDLQSFATQIYSVRLEMNGQVLCTQNLLKTQAPCLSISLNVYPNPANEELNIHTLSNVLDKISVQIIDMAGRIVIIKHDVVRSSDNVHKINISNLIEGTYILQVASENFYCVEKFIKK